MNGALQKSLTNPWLASLVSFLLVIAFLACVFLCLPKPFPTGENVMAMPWWAPLGGSIGSFAVVVGLMFVQKVGAGILAGLTITANILMSLIFDKYGMFGIQQHPLSLGRIAGGALMVAGICPYVEVLINCLRIIISLNFQNNNIVLTYLVYF